MPQSKSEGIIVFLLPITEDRKIIGFKNVGRGWTLHAEDFREQDQPHLLDIMGDEADIRRLAYIGNAMNIAFEEYEPATGDIGGVEAFVTTTQLRALTPILSRMGLRPRHIDDVIIPKTCIV